MFKKVISLALSVVFSLQTCGFAQAGQLNLAGYLGQGSGAPALDRFRPAHLRYFSYEPKSDNFQILLDKADENGLSDIQVKDKADELMRYFRIGLSLPNDKFWVNLRPDAPEQIIDPELERTDIGKIMLEADLQLKKDTASWTSPQTKEGKEYWDKLYKKAGELFGTENITIPTITRPWIVPGEIIVRESGNSAYIYKAALKVMLEEDYLKSSQLSAVSSQQYNFTDPRLKELNQYSTQLIRELIIPQLTKEVNRAKRYAGLRQVYYSLILARWFKQSYQNSGAQEHQGTRAPANETNSLAKLIDSGNLSNLTSQEPWSKDTYYQGYKKSFEQGEYNLSQTVHTPTGQLIRRYVSGGISAGSALTVDNHYNIPGVEKNPSGTNAKLFKYMSGSDAPVAIATASPLTLDKEMSKRLEGWKIFESIEMLALNQPEVSFETNIFIGGDEKVKKVYTVIKASTYQWGQSRPLNIKFWTIELLENAKSKDPIARIKVFRNGNFSAMTAENLSDSDTERDLIVAKIIRHFSLDKSQMAELEKKSGASLSKELMKVKNSSEILEDELKKQGVTADGIKTNLFEHSKHPDSYYKTSIDFEHKNLRLYLLIGVFPVNTKSGGYEIRINGNGVYVQINVPRNGGAKVKTISESISNLHIDNLKKLADEIRQALGISGASSAIVTKGAAPEDIGAVDFRIMDMLIQPAGSFSGLDFSPVRLSSSALEAMDLDKIFGGIKQMTSKDMLASPLRLKEYISACIFKGKIDEKADDFILSMLEVFQLQAEEGIESASQDREAVVLADTRGYVLPEKRLAASNGYGLN